MSMARGGVDWEGEIVASLHRLSHFLRARPDAARERDAEFDRLHKAFHVSLIAACGSPRMMAAQSDLYDQAHRYRRLMMAQFPDPSPFLAEHDRLADLAIARAGAAAEEALTAHIATTMRLVYPEGEPR